MLKAAKARSGDRAEKPPFISGLLPAPPPDDVVLADLVAFFRDPVKGFYRALDFTLPWEVDGVEDAMPVDINALEEWTVGDRMLADMLRGMAAEEARHAEWRRGTLPPGQLGWRKATEIRDQSALLADDRTARTARPTPMPSTSTSTSAVGGWRAPSLRCSATGWSR